MHIAFNATALLSPFTGLGQYTYELAKRLVAAREHEVDLFYGMDWGREVREAPLPGAGTWGPLVRRHLPYAYELTRFVKNRRFGARVPSHALVCSDSAGSLPRATTYGVRLYSMPHSETCR